MACPIVVKFTAKTSTDIHDVINVLASTGPIEIPLNATSKKAVPRIDKAIVNVGNVIMGETGTASVVISNKARVVHCVCASGTALP